jgi:hypothetical protein
MIIRKELLIIKNFQKNIITTHQNEITAHNGILIILVGKMKITIIAITILLITIEMKIIVIIIFKSIYF